MNQPGLCDLCGGSGVLYSCSLCGRRACGNCISVRGVCKDCLSGTKVLPKKE